LQFSSENGRCGTRPEKAGCRGGLCGNALCGFLIRLDLNFYLQAVEDNELVMRLVVPGEEPLPFRFRVARGVVASCLAAVGGA